MGKKTAVVKTKTAAKKRFSKSGGKNGVIKRTRAYHRHLLTKKSAKRCRNLRESSIVGQDMHRTISRLLPYQ
jgi:large subunit ribosomal protein L35